MSYKTACAAAFIAAATGVSAQQFAGGTLGLEYNYLYEGNSAAVTTYYGGVEYAISRDIGVALDLKGDSGDTDYNAFTLHGIYHLNGNASVGAYFGQGSSGGDSANIYGIEGGTSLSTTNIGGYIGLNGGGFALGFNTESPIGQSFEIYSDFDFIEAEGAWVSQNELGVQYNMATGLELYAHYGRGSAGYGSFAGSTDYIGVGARINFGAARGTTFEAR